MTQMNMTKHLHERLGKRGGYSYRPADDAHPTAMTTWWEGLTKFEFSERQSGAQLTVKYWVPQRMIEAAVRRDTCKDAGGPIGFACSECGEVFEVLVAGSDYRVAPNYCPNCGRRVVYERKDGDWMDVEFIEQSHEILHVFGGVDTIAEAARTCYQSEAKDEGADERLVRSLIKNHHDAMLEFAYLICRVTCDRSIAQELTRHRLFSFAMESQRYVDGTKKGIRFIFPDVGEVNDVSPRIELPCGFAADSYRSMVKGGAKPEIARYVLPNATATTIVIGGNMREWRSAMKLRCSKSAHPMMRKLMTGILEDAKRRVPVIFDDINGGGDEAT